MKRENYAKADRREAGGIDQPHDPSEYAQCSEKKRLFDKGKESSRRREWLGCSTALLTDLAG
jgi:hypothetical protein